MDPSIKNMIHNVTYLGAYLPDYPRHRIIQSGLRELGVSVFETQDRSFLPLRWWRLAKAMRESQKDAPIIIGEASNYLSPVLLEARWLDYPVIFDVFVSLKDHIEDLGRGWSTKIIAYFMEWIDRINNMAASAVLLDTGEHRNYFIKNLGLRPEKAYVAYVGAETQLFHPRPRTLDKPANPFQILFYGAFHLLHGIDVVIRAASEIQRIRKDIHFQIVGDGPTKSEMRMLVDKLQLTNLSFGPAYIPYSHLPELISSANVCLGIFGDRPKTMRVIPNKLYQCAAMGIPVITADTPAIREGFSEDEIECVPPGDYRSLAQAILNLADNPEKCNRIGKAGMKAIQERYNPRVIASQVLEACQSVIA